MRLRWAAITAALAGLAFVVPAQAQEEMAAEAAAAPEMRPDGFRIAEGANGFQLVEHGIWRQPLVVSSGRIRVSGMLSRGRRGMILTTKSDEVWIVESEEVTDDLIGSNVTVEGVVAGMDRLRADWIGADCHPS
ncbi:DUF5818 domain-containing protein [Altererythrobacter sp. H2]|uniref:DUF5818 domain-containing protein n=1 Tax=Altererythrobacter sp. H2 TaxID=3108391 RepID=UPI002B4BCD22|nr:DUF5818 domain-containing protein [Altererythrobacter sp. H2]WRK94491.1 DUF5818 domain-containing protein [Altererythrobacter sp. H2]